MRLRIVRADPAGNITLFVLDPVEKSQRPGIAEKLMELVPSEQVGFVCSDGGMEMAAGEFCGNATRSYAMLAAKQQHSTGVSEMMLRVSGCKNPVLTTVDTQKGTAWARMPLPESIGETAVEGILCPIVDLGGIVHIVARGVEPSKEFFRSAEEQLVKYTEAEAYGVMFLSSDGKTVIPLVKVPAVNSLMWEGSCGSGTMACAVSEAIGRPDGEYVFVCSQPAGELEARVTVRDGVVVEASIGGKVTLDEEITVEV